MQGHPVDVIINNEPSWVDVTSVIVAIVAAIVAAVAAAIIAYQSRQTRKATEATQAAVMIARKSAIDAEMPRLTVTVPPVRGTAYRPSPANDPHAFVKTEQPGFLSPAEEFVLPRDAEVPLALRFMVKIRNDGPRLAFVQVNQPHGRRELMNGHRLPIKPGEGINLEAERIATVGEWIAIEKAFAGDGAPSDAESALVFQLEYLFPGMVGATDHHQVFMRGSVLERVPGNNAAWRVVTFLGETYPQGAHIAVDVHPFIRRYFSNRPGDTTMNWID